MVDHWVRAGFCENAPGWFGNKRAVAITRSYPRIVSGQWARIINVPNRLNIQHNVVGWGD
jgi:hypothetical protein